MQSVSRILIPLLLGATLASAQNTSQPSGRSGETAPAQNTTVNPAPQSSLIQILTPVQGQASTSNVVQVRYQLTNPAAAAGSPNFQLQIDGADPITTTATDFTFTGLAPGAHSIAVVLVDANGTPTQGGRSVVQFSVKDSNAASHSATPSQPSAPPRASIIPRELGGTLDNDDEPTVPNNSLPLVSLIGFGVLIGGAVTGIKKRG
jgi:hypothetical protein